MPATIRVVVLCSMAFGTESRRQYQVINGHDLECADAALAPLIWSAAVGERWPTTTVTEFLHVTRQALHKRVLAGTALGLPGQGTTWFPVWQFDLGAHVVRPTVADVVKVFRDEMGSADPFVIASWATTDQHELGVSPEEWLAAGKDPSPRSCV